VGLRSYFNLSPPQRGGDFEPKKKKKKKKKSFDSHLSTWLVLRVGKVTLNLENKTGNQEYILMYFGVALNKLRLPNF